MPDIPSNSPELAVKRAQWAEMGRTDLFWFAKFVLAYTRLVERVHRPICKMLQDITKRRVLITMPRGFYKTTLCSIAYPIWRSVNDCDITILGAMNTMRNAQLKSREIRGHFEHNEFFRWLYPELIPDFNHTPWSDNGACVTRNKHTAESTFEPTGAAGTTISRHYDEIVMDDLVTAKLDDFTGEEILPGRQDIEQAIGWYRQSAALLRDMRESRIIHVGTRWAKDDVIAFVMKHNKEFRENSYQLTAEVDGVPTMPEWYPREVLDDLKSNGSIGSTIYRLWYLNEPTDPSEIIFKLRDEHYYNPVRLSQEARMAMTKYTGSDLAGWEGDAGSNNTIVTIGVDADNVRWVLDIKCGRFDPSTMIELLFATYDAYEPRVITLEKVAYQAAMAHFMRKEMRARGRALPILEIPRGVKSKAERILKLQPWFENDMIRIPGGAKALVNELQDFRLDKRRTGRTDILDALADAVEQSVHAIPGPVQAKRKHYTAEDMAHYNQRFYDPKWGIAELKKSKKGTGMFGEQVAGSLAWTAREN